MAGGESFGYDRRRDDDRLQNEAHTYVTLGVLAFAFIAALLLLSSHYSLWDRAYYAMVWSAVVGGGAALAGKAMFWTYNFLRDARSRREGT